MAKTAGGMFSNLNKDAIFEIAFGVGLGLLLVALLSMVLGRANPFKMNLENAEDAEDLEHGERGRARRAAKQKARHKKRMARIRRKRKEGTYSGSAGEESSTDDGEGEEDTGEYEEEENLEYDDDYR